MAAAIPWTDVLSTLAQVTGAIVAASWAVIKLRHERPHRSRLTLTPTLDVRADRSRDVTFVAVTTTVTNVGSELVGLAAGSKPEIEIWALSLLSTDLQARPSPTEATELDLFKPWPVKPTRDMQVRRELRSGQSVVFATVVEIPGCQVGVKARATIAYGSKNEEIVGECVSLRQIEEDGSVA